jgi:hypothetical protein
MEAISKAIPLLLTATITKFGSDFNYLLTNSNDRPFWEIAVLTISRSPRKSLDANYKARPLLETAE